MALDLAINDIAQDFYLGNIGSANSKYFSALDGLGEDEYFVKNAQNVLKMQENEDWVGLGDFFCEILQKNKKT